MSEVQEENCNLRHKLKHLQLELDAKSKVIQRSLNDKFSHNSLPLHPRRNGLFYVNNDFFLVGTLASDRSV